MDSRFLQSFVSVVEAGSIAEAARRLDLSAATIAQRLRVLEAEIGRQLIVRSGRTVKPTVAGARILDRARLVLREVRDMESAATGNRPASRPVALGRDADRPDRHRARRAQGLGPGLPADQLYIEPASTTVLYGRLMAGELDAAVLVHPMFALPKTCAWVPLRREALVLLTPAAMKVRDALETIRREPFIRYDRQVIAGKMADDYLRQHGIRPRLRVELDGIEYIAKFVAEGLGGVGAAGLGGRRSGQSAVRRWPLPGPVPTREVGVVWQRSTVHAPLVDAFVALARRHYRVA